MIEVEITVIVDNVTFRVQQEFVSTGMFNTDKYEKAQSLLSESTLKIKKGLESQK